MDNNGETPEQQTYIKDIISRSGDWLSTALQVRREPGNLKFEKGASSRTHRHAHTPGGGAAGGVGSAGRRAVYIGGNLTDTLSFAYTVSVGDMADPLDYLDTRPAAKTQRFSRALMVPEGGAAITAVGYGPPQAPPTTLATSSSPRSASPRC